MFPRKACVDINVYTHTRTCTFVSLLIPCFLLQQQLIETGQMDRGKQKYPVTELEDLIQDFETEVQELEKSPMETMPAPVSYTSCDCTIKFTSPYRFAWSSTAEKT